MGNLRSHTSVQSQDDDLRLFRELLRRESEFAAREGIQVIPFESEDVPHFRRLSSEKQQEAIRQISETLAVYEEMVEESLSLRDNSQLLWRCMRRLKLVPQGDLFDKLSNEDVIVIFAPDQRQIFRNLEFLKLSILTLEELYTTEWYRYTRREDRIAGQILEVASYLLSGRKNGTFDPGIEEHTLEQMGSSLGPSKIRVKINYLSPAHTAGKITGIVVLERAWVIKD
jgi:hypothetical protein